MRYAYEIQPDGSKTVFAFPDEFSRAQWIGGNPSTRRVLSGNSREVKSARYRGVVYGAYGDAEAPGQPPAKNQDERRGEKP